MRICWISNMSVLSSRVLDTVVPTKGSGRTSCPCSFSVENAVLQPSCATGHSVARRSGMRDDKRRSIVGCVNCCALLAFTASLVEVVESSKIFPKDKKSYVSTRIFCLIW